MKGGSMLNIVVCIKQVPYPDTPASVYVVDNTAKKIVLPGDVPLVISPFDENAVEAGIRLKEQAGGKVTVLSLATRAATDVIRDLRHALAMGADSAVLLDDEAFTSGDSHGTAYCLAMAIKKLGNADIIICGRQAADWDAGQTGLGIAEILNLPAATPVRKITARENRVEVECIRENGYEVQELPLPVLLAVSNEANTPRIAPLPGVIKAAKKKIPTWNAADIGADLDRVGLKGSKTAILELSIPKHEGICELIQGEGLEEAAFNLVNRLKQEKII